MGRRDGRFCVLVVARIARPPFKPMTDNAINARALAALMLDAGREPLWVLMMVAAYYGEQQGREAALAVIEERELARLV
jgi:hypothetical protein